MGAGFALFVDAADATRVIELARSKGVGALLAGRVEKGPKQVVIEPLGLRYAADSLALR